MCIVADFMEDPKVASTNFSIQPAIATGITNPYGGINAFTPLFMNCITYDLAMRGAKVLIDSASYVEQMRAALTQEITFAMGLDEGQQVAPVVF
jgi:hypothetical protein